MTGPQPAGRACRDTSAEQGFRGGDGVGTSLPPGGGSCNRGSGGPRTGRSWAAEPRVLHDPSGAAVRSTVVREAVGTCFPLVS